MTDPGNLPRRFRGRLDREVRLRALRARSTRVTVGDGTVVRSGLRLDLGPGGRLEVGRGCVLDHDLTAQVYGELVLGDRVILGHGVTLAANEHLSIGADSLLAELVSVRDHDHSFDDPSVPVRDQGAVCAPVRIGRDVWLGTRVVVTRGITIGDHAVVGACAVVTHDVPGGQLWAGVPARQIGWRPGFGPDVA